MSAWRRVAMEMVPQLRKKIERSENVGMFFVDLSCAFSQAHRDPPNDALICGCYDFAWWCVNGSRSGDLAGVALVAFYEHLPTDPPVRARVPEFLTLEQFRSAAEAFKYFLTPEEAANFRAEYETRRRQIESAAAKQALLQRASSRRKC